MTEGIRPTVPLDDEPFLALALRYLDGFTSPEEEAAIAEQLQTQPDRRDQFVMLCRHAGMLRETFSAEAESHEAREMSYSEKGWGTSVPSGAGATFPIIDSQSPILDLSVHPSSFSLQHSYLGGVLFSYLAATVILGVGILIGAVLHVSQPVQVATPSTPLPSPLLPLPPIIGRITGMVDCQWSDPATEAFNGAYVPRGRKYALSSGLMEITYDAGAKVVLQGPCTYEVESAAGGFLSLGKLTARVEKKAEGGGRKAEEATHLPSPFGRGAGGEGCQKDGNRDQSQTALTLTLSQRERGPDSSSAFRLPPSALFAVHTPTAVVTDLGTEFGVEVDKQGATTSHVYRGSVRLQAISSDGEAKGTGKVLHANESACVVNGDGSPVIVLKSPIEPTDFVRKLVPRDAAGSLRRNLVAYWSFDDPANLGKNAIGGGDLTPENAPEYESSGLLGGAIRLHGNAQKDMLLYQSGRGVPTGVPTGDSSYSVSVWFRINSFDSEIKAGILGWGEPAFGRVNVLAIGDRKENISIQNYWWDNDINADAGREPLLHGWHHLVATYDRLTRLHRLFLDGRWIGSRPVQNRPNFGMSNFAVGRACMEPKMTPEYFDGWLDEVGIWGREISEAEVARLYNHGKGLSPLPQKTSGDTAAPAPPSSERMKGGQSPRK